MRFGDFLRTTVLLSLASATALAAVTVAGGAEQGDGLVVGIGGAWWVLAGALGTWIGRRPSASGPIASLLAGARTQTSLPDMAPARILFNRLWPLLGSTIVAGAVAFTIPQVPAVAAGFAVMWSLAWRHQASAVIAIEERDGVRFYIARTSPLEPIALVRTPGFRSNRFELNGSVDQATRVRPPV